MNRNELDFVRQMFDGIAPHYDFLNRLLSMRQDVYWRKTMVSSLDLAPGARVLDAACGTADVGIEIVRQSRGEVTVVGIDFAPQMLQLAQPKITRTSSFGAIVLAAADAFDLPFAAGGFDAVTMAFGIRNIQDKVTVLKAFWQQLKPGGRLAILELGTPTRGAARQVFLFYFNRLLPYIGRWFSKHRFAYTYLPDSVANFPAPDQFSALMRQAGFENIRYRSMTNGITVLFVGEKPGFVSQKLA